MPLALHLDPMSWICSFSCSYFSSSSFSSPHTLPLLHASRSKIDLPTIWLAHVFPHSASLMRRMVATRTCICPRGRMKTLSLCCSPPLCSHHEASGSHRGQGGAVGPRVWRGVRLVWLRRYVNLTHSLAVFIYLFIFSIVPFWPIFIRTSKLNNHKWDLCYIEVKSLESPFLSSILVRLGHTQWQ